jgi:hypothetical protein
MIGTKKHNTYLDGLSSSRIRPSLSFDLPLTQYILKYKRNSTVYYKNQIRPHGLAGDLTGLYLTQADLARIKKGEKISLRKMAFDSLVRPDFQVSSGWKTQKLIFRAERRSDIFEAIQERYSSLSDYMADLFRGTVQGVSAVRVWNVSLVGAVIFGMFLMTMIYRYLGQGAYAGTSGTVLAYQSQDVSSGKVLGAETKNSKEEDEYTAKLIAEYNRKIQEGREDESMEKEIREMVKGYPIEKMAPYIARKDKIVAAFLIGIAKKESDWGNHAPVYQGQDCYNFWGYKGIRDKMGTGGHTCFDSYQDAVDTVAKRIEFLVSSEKINTPGKMVVVWKCGYDCSWDDQSAVKKWISDVDMYFKKFNDKTS